jgi:hypothetical protein
MREGFFRLCLVSAFVLSSTATSGCGTKDVVVAQVNIGQPCKMTSDCLLGEYCDTETCDADGGTCQVPPTTCQSDDSYDQVCGCDGAVFYWNDCVRRSLGIAASTHDCTSALPQDCADQPCPSGFICGKFNGNCSPAEKPLSTCWALPATCPADNMGFYSSCDNMRPCMNLCTAIGTGEQFKALPPFGSSCSN